MKRLLHVVGTRPNYMKIAPIMQEAARYPNEFEQSLVHTGQHYDPNMSEVFFADLGLPHPDLNLEVGSGSHAWQTAQVMLRFEAVLSASRPDWVIVPGDVNSTLACALVASKLGVRIAHVEAGLRSFDRSMPEEINRVLTDQLSDLLFTPSQDGNENLLREGIAPEKVRFVGNVMIDSLVRLLPAAARCWPTLRSRYNLSRYMLVTLHRPSNVDDPVVLGEVIAALNEISQEVAVVFPIHPRTHKRLAEFNFELHPNLQLIEPLGYLEFLALQSHANLVLTDSGGIQEETTYLGVPCLTARPNTERPVTLSVGTNRLVMSNRDALVGAARSALSAPFPSCPRQVPELWDGRAAERIVAVFREVSA